MATLEKNDMSYLKKELYELVKSEQRIFDFIQDVSLDGLWYRDIENPENEWRNPRFWLTLGYSPGEIPHTSSAWKNSINADDYKSATDNFNKHCENPDHPYEQIVRYTHKNGSTVWMRLRGLAIRNKKGKAIRMVGTYIDITKEKESEDKHSILFNSIDEGFCIIEMIFDRQKKPVDYRFLVINASFERQTGMKDAAGKRMREFAPNHEDHWFETYGKIALTGESIRFENKAEQLHRWYDVYAFRFGKPENMQVAILFNDITARKQGEEMVRLLNDELERNLKQLESVNKELESFSYTVSHDLRAPLRAINGYSKMLGEDFSEKLPAEAQKHLEAISKNATKMGTLIDDLLAFSRLGRKEIERARIDTGEMVGSVVEEICNERSADKAIFKTGALLPAYGDLTLIKQVWINLISNAQKYSRNNPSPSIEISSTNNGRETTYCIKDNGVGFDMKYAGKLFGVFQRLHSEQEFEGTGVGLAIVHKIISRHGGKVWAEAKPNEGACFYFSLPGRSS